MDLLAAELIGLPEFAKLVFLALPFPIYERLADNAALTEPIDGDRLSCGVEGVPGEFAERCYSSYEFNSIAEDTTPEALGRCY